MSSDATNRTTATHAVRRVLSVTGLDQTLVIYPVLEPALVV